MSFGEFFQGFGSLGDAYREGQERAQQKSALAALGTQLQGGDYAGAAKTAFNAGDVGTGMSLLKIVQDRQNQQSNTAALNGLIGGLYGGGVPDYSGTGPGGTIAPTSGASAKPYQTNDPVADDLKPHQKALLNAIAGGESAGKYNVRFTPQGGATFSDLSQHPNIAAMGPDGPSTAAGRYQFIKGTWDSVGGGDFSPANQDHAALKLAQRDYKARTGRDLDADLQQNGFTPQIAQALAPTWTSFGGKGANRAVATFNNSLSRYAGGAGPQVASASTGLPPGASGLNPDAAPSDQLAALRAPPLLPQRPANLSAAPIQVASADPDMPLPMSSPAPMPAPMRGAPALVGAPPPIARSAPQPGGAVASLVGQPPPAEIGVDNNILNAPMRSDGVPQAAVPAAAPVAAQPRAAVANADDDDTDAPAAAPTPVPPQVRAQVSAQAPQHLADAGLPPQVSAPVGATQPASQQRIAALLRASMLPGLSEGQSKVVSTLLTNELEQTKLPESVKQYIFAKSPQGGGFDGSFADFQNKKGDEGAKITAQLQAREQYAITHGMDPKDPGVQAWIMGGRTTTGHVLKPGDILAGPAGQTLAQNAAAGGNLSDDAVDLAARQSIAGDTRALTGLGRGAQGGADLARIKARQAQIMREQGLDPTDVLQAQANAQGRNAEQRSLGTSSGRMSQAAVEAENAITFALQASDKVARTQFVPLNRVIQMVQSNAGDPAIREFNAANNALVNTYSRAISPTGVSTDSARQHAYDLLQTANTKEQYAGVVDLLHREIQAAHKSPQQARTILESERQSAKSGAAPAPTMVPNPVAPAQPQRQTAPQASQYREGQTATGPGGQKVIFSRGQWAPVQAAPASTASPQAGGVL